VNAFHFRSQSFPDDKPARIIPARVDSLPRGDSLLDVGDCCTLLIKRGDRPHFRDVRAKPYCHDRFLGLEVWLYRQLR
jgi:hypothetical protein